MGDEEVVFTRLEKDLSLDSIDVSASNVRKSKQRSGLEELKASIQHLGLIQPVVVIKRGERYSLIAGQRRFLAFRDLGRPTIPALVIEPVGSLTQRIISFGENIQRKKLPYDDTIRVCDELFKAYRGSPTQRVRKISEELGVSTSTVTNYLSYRLIPPEVQEMVTAGQLNAKVAYRITSAFWPNRPKIIAVAKEATKMTAPEWERALDAGERNPQAPVTEIVKEAKSPPTRFEFVVVLDQESRDGLQQLAERRHMDIPELIRSLIDAALKEEEG